MFTDENVHIVQAETSDDVAEKADEVVALNPGYDISAMLVCRKTDIVYFIDIPSGHSFITVLKKLPESE